MVQSFLTQRLFKGTLVIKGSRRALEEHLDTRLALKGLPKGHLNFTRRTLAYSKSTGREFLHSGT